MTSETPTPRRRLDPAARREELLEAARLVFSEKSYAEATMSEIADAAGASEALVFRYFPTKAELYAELMERALAALAAEQERVVAAAGPGQPVMAQLRLTTRAYADFIKANSQHARPDAIAGEPREAARVRAQARSRYVEGLRSMLAPREDVRHEYALWGFMGFVDAACVAWIDRGCPDSERDALVETCLGALEGALGDWDA
ncbi:TetR/AcrR family transcriptional regulator [Demequina sp. TTPB684]|uniref:TetR/AcrR family transcriptional regulator n=1 Tax=unclassified Demequina TaxID=2620311 RepID=UPI001CF531E5|nr:MULTISPECIES: TetR/AcrR family transcriptional regulator [unclassified Demequina]MCB2412511.1 TetR/AcrR family transcriptional regulator [Demequina sp. TTPB684]UPU88786.1 TetR/AcrR family transcriptional regulator [Demequina sp. TMPB413]